MASARGRRSCLRLECELLEERVLLNGNPFPSLPALPPLAPPELLHARRDGLGTLTDLTDQISLAVANQAGTTGDEIVYGDPAQDQVSVAVNGTQVVVRDQATGLETPAAVLLAALNNGIPDLIVCNSGSNSVLVFPGLGNGQFGAEVNGGRGIATGTDPVNVAMVQPGNNAPPELLVTNKGSNTITVLSGQEVGGRWSLVVTAQLSAGQAPTSATVQNLGAGKPDLVITDGGSDQVRILPWNDQGDFDTNAERILPTGQNPQMSLVADFAGDGTPGLVTINASSNDLTYYDDIDSAHPVAREISSGGQDPVAALLLHTATGATDLVVANQGDGTLALFSVGPNGLQLIATQQSPGGHPTSLAAAPSGDPFSFYVVDAGQESAAVMSFAAEIGGGSSAPPGPSPSSTQKDTALLSPTESALLSLDSGKSQQADSGQTVSLQPLTATTVAVVPTLLVGEETGGFAQENASSHAGGTSTLPLLVPAQLALLCPNGCGGEEHTQRQHEPEASTAPPEEPGVQRFVLGADEGTAPVIGEDGTTEEAHPVPPMMIDPLSDPVTRAPAAESAQPPGLENPPAASAGTRQLPSSQEQEPQRSALTRADPGAEAWERALLTGVALGLVWERQRREGESDPAWAASKTAR